MTHYIPAQAGAAAYLSPRAYTARPLAPLIEAINIIGWQIDNGIARPMFATATYEFIEANYFISFPTFDKAVTTPDHDHFSSLKEWSLACMAVAEFGDAE